MTWRVIGHYLATGWEGLRPLLLLPYRQAIAVCSRSGQEVQRVLLQLSRRLRQAIAVYWPSGQEGLSPVERYRQTLIRSVAAVGVGSISLKIGCYSADAESGYTGTMRICLS
jgi:hypothetical protein